MSEPMERYPLVDLAYKLLKSNSRYFTDAKSACGNPNTIVGAVMAFTSGNPRWATEAAVTVAIEIIDAEGGL